VAAPYKRALVILRRHGEPVARFDLPVVDGEVDRAAFAGALADAVEIDGARWLARDYLGPDPKHPTPDATVAICTRERPADLRRALAAVRALSPAPGEVLVIDNSPRSTATREIVGESGARYVCEPRRGLDYARNRALKEARADLIAFTDDDAVPEPAWLDALLRPFADARVWCVTGLTLPLELETPAQEWFERYSSFSRGFRRRVFDGTRHDPLAVGAVGAGANMAVRRSILTRLGGFDEALDAGTPTRSGGDHEMFGRILAAGHQIVYEPAAVSWHRHRRTWQELRDTLHGYGVGVFAIMTRRLLREREPRALRHPLRWLYRHHLPLLWNALRRRPESVPPDLICAELAGCLRGPFEYARSVRRARRDVR
jgi:GT2 family glycosyltransferase